MERDFLGKHSSSLSNIYCSFRRGRHVRLVVAAILPSLVILQYRKHLGDVVSGIGGGRLGPPLRRPSSDPLWALSQANSGAPAGTTGDQTREHSLDPDLSWQSTRLDTPHHHLQRCLSCVVKELRLQIRGTCCLCVVVTCNCLLPLSFRVIMLV